MEKSERNVIRLCIGLLENENVPRNVVISALKDLINDGTGNDEGADAIFTPSERSADSAASMDMEEGNERQVAESENIKNAAQPERALPAESEEAPGESHCFPFRRRRRF